MKLTIADCLFIAAIVALILAGAPTRDSNYRRCMVALNWGGLVLCGFYRLLGL